MIYFPNKQLLPFVPETENNSSNKTYQWIFQKKSTSIRKMIVFQIDVRLRHVCHGTVSNDAV